MESQVKKIVAKGRHVRISSQKVRMVVGALKGKPVESVLNTLKFMPQKSAKILDKIVRSAVANAEHNHKINVDELMLNNIVVDQGPSQKRFMARARGRGSRILKRTSHITVTLTEFSG